MTSNECLVNAITFQQDAAYFYARAVEESAKGNFEFARIYQGIAATSYKGMVALMAIAEPID